MKPILFNTEMVHAILDGRKTVTRRVVKPQPKAVYHDGKVYDDDGLYVVVENQNGRVEQIELPYHTGDILYVRETWQKNPYGIGWPYFYKASPEQFDHAPNKWSPSIHMPREAARIFLRVTDVKVDRLQEIDDTQAVIEGAEGEFCNCDGSEVFCSRCCNTGWLISPRSKFSCIWDSTIRPKDRALYGWEANPWVWVIEFEKIPKPV